MRYSDSKKEIMEALKQDRKDLQTRLKTHPAEKDAITTKINAINAVIRSGNINLKYPIYSTVCCPTWTKAHKMGTGSEGDASLLWDIKQGTTIGHDLPNVLYCPWCGAPREGDRLSYIDEIERERNTLIQRLKSSLQRIHELECENDDLDDRFDQIYTIINRDRE